MSVPPPAPARASFPTSNLRTTPWTVRRKVQPKPIMPLLTQRYQVSWLTQLGEIEDFARMGPDLPLFETAFSALARGALVGTKDGPVAVEDVLPGTEIMTTDGPQPLLWKGQMTLNPATREKVRLFRIPADALGLGRPSLDLMLGAAAHLVSRQPRLRELIGADAALVPVAPLADGISVVEITPISTVQTYHLGFASHAVFTVNGIEVESVHPGIMDAAHGIELQDLYLSLFPHLARLRDFGGLALPRVAEDEVLSVTAA